MKTLATLIIAVCFAGAAYAGCGKKIEVKGKLSTYDSEKKELTVSGKKDTEDKKITLAATYVVKDAEGAEVKIEDVVGKRVNISTDKHTQKAEAITVVAKKPKAKDSEA